MAGLYKAYPEYDSCESLPPSNKPAHWVGMQVRHALRSASSSGSAIKGTVSSEPADHLFPAYSASGQDVWTVDWIYNEPGIVLSAVGARCGKTFRAEGKWSVVANTGVFLLRPKMNRDFFWYVTNDESFWEKGGSAQPYVQVPSTLAKRIGVPPLPEQKQIAKFLDHETAKIDLLIAKQQALIALLKEKRQAVISHAVTKGLPSTSSGQGNPNAKMKDSGVEWLDSLPSHWNLIKLSYILKLQSGDGITSNNIEAVGDYPVYGGNGQRGFTSTYNCEGKYVLIGRQGALCGNVNLAENKFFASEHAVVVYPRISFDTVYLAEMLRFLDLGQYSVSAAQPGVSVERLNMLKVICPPLDEQRCIAKFVTDEIVKFDELSEHSVNAITLLQERRTALISAAVTGKIDVRDWEPAPDIKDEL